MIPLIPIILGGLNAMGAGVVPALIGIGVVGLVLVLINILFNYMLFSAKR